MSTRSKIVPMSASVLSFCLALSGCGDSTPPAAKDIPSTVPVMTPMAATTSDLPKTTIYVTPDAPALPPAPPPPGAPVQTEIQLDPAKYPQDTPEKAIDSLAKAIETNDLAYQIAWLSTPDFTQRMITKYKTIAATVAANQSPEKAQIRMSQLATIRKMQAEKSTSHGKVNGVEWYRFQLGDGLLIQFEKQPDGRWAWNPHVRAVK